MRQATYALLLSLALAHGAAAADAAPPAKAAATKGGSSAYKPSEETLEVYKTKCQACHMADGNSPLPLMNFADGLWKHGSSLKEIEAVIAEGVPGTAMLPFKTQVTPAQVQALAKYVRSFDKKPLAPAAKGKAAKPAAKPTTD